MPCCAVGLQLGLQVLWRHSTPHAKAWRLAVEGAPNNTSWLCPGVIPLRVSSQGISKFADLWQFRHQLCITV
jgi:hypothetical protein